MLHYLPFSEFISRHSMEGKFTFVDQRVLGLLGYSPPELLGKPCFEYFHPEDQSHMKESFEQGNQTQILKIQPTNAQCSCSVEVEGSSFVRNVPVQGQEQGVGVVTDSCVCLLEPLHGRRRVHRLHQHFGQVSRALNFC